MGRGLHVGSLPGLTDRDYFLQFHDWIARLSHKKRPGLLGDRTFQTLMIADDHVVPMMPDDHYGKASSDDAWRSWGLAFMDAGSLMIDAELLALDIP